MKRTSLTTGSSLGRRGFVLGGVALLMATLTGCQSIDVNASNVAQVVVVNASETSNGYDVYANNNLLVSNLGYPYHTSPISVAPGGYTISADTPGTTQVLTSTGAGLSNGHEYTVVVGNVAASLQETVYLDQSTAAPSGQISVRFIDEATKVGAVDVYLVPSSGKLSTTSPVVTGLTFSGNSGYIAVPVDTYAIDVVPSGTVPVATTVTLMTGANVGYVSGDVRTVILVDQQITTTPGVAAIVIPDYDPAGS